MSTWKKFALVNGALLVGTLTFLFIVPPETPLWLYATLTGVAVVAFNLMLLRPRQNKDNRRGDSSKDIAIAIVGLLIIILDLLWRRAH